MSRIHSLDYLKLLMAILVVFGHARWMQNNLSPAIFMLGNGLMRVIVPSFCIISGYFFFRAVEKGAGRVWLWRVTAFYGFFKLVYLPFWMGDVHGVTSLIKTLVLGYYHLWFMAGIIFAAFAILMLRKLMRRLSPAAEIPVLVALAALCGVMGVVMQDLNLSGAVEIGQRKYQNGLFICFPFVVMGYLIARQIANRGMSWLPSNRALLIGTGFGFALLAGEAWLVQANWGQHIMLDIPATAYVAAPMLFLLMLRTTMPAPPVRLDPISAMIYFMHVMVLELAFRAGLESPFALMGLGVGIPALLGLAVGGLGLPGFGKASPRGQAGTPTSSDRAAL